MSEPELIANQSPDSQHPQAAHGSSINQIRVGLPRSAWELVVATLLALSVAVNLTAYFKMRDIDTRKWLHDYDLNQFQMGPFRELQNKVAVDEELMKIFGPQCMRDKH